jgi:hypothetical protein
LLFIVHGCEAAFRCIFIWHFDISVMTS